VGEHPNIKNLYLFNGFGSKGVLYAPDAARQLVDSIMRGTPIDTDISVRRYFKA
jgi:glycine/D-amino acid oxidase-like deaminating enzyme